MRSILTSILLTISVISLAQTIKVGIYPNPPLINIDETGKASGFTIDLLDEIAMKEGWELQYIIYDFSSCLLALGADEITIMPALAYSIERDSLFILNKTSVLTNWAKIYKHPDDETEYSSIEQLRNMNIAVLEDDYYVQNGDDGLKDILDELDISAQITNFPSYETVIGKIEKGNVDLGLVSRYYGVLKTESRDVVKTPLSIAYTSVRFGFSRIEENLNLAQQLDEDLKNLINDRASLYYTLEKKYLAFTPQAFIPQWLWRALLLVTIGLVTLAVFIVLLQYQVKKKTNELENTNHKLVESEQEARLAVQTIEASQDIGFWFQEGNPFIKVNNAAIELTGFTEKELLSMVPIDLIASNKNQKYYDSLRSNDWNGHILIEETFKTKKGESFPVELSLDQFELDGQTYICGFARNITARVKAEQELVERNKELNVLYKIAQFVAERDNSVNEIFEYTLNILLSAWLYPEATVARINFLEREFLSNKYKKPESVLKEVIYSGETEVGWIEVGYSKFMPAADEGPFLKEEKSLLNGIAKQLSRMLDSKDAERRIISSILSTEDNERSRISKELHDSVGQTLSAISLNLDSICTSNTLSEAERTKLKSIDNLLKEAIAESRSVSHNLMPPVLTDLGYASAVENLLSSIEGVGKTSFSFHSNESKKEVKKEIEYTLFRITQEAINNVIKYAEAKEVIIQYLIYDDVISLSIEDDGNGFEMKNADKKHNFGLNSMKNRAISIDGELTIDSSPGNGTGIHLTVPL